MRFLGILIALAALSNPVLKLLADVHAAAPGVLTQDAVQLAASLVFAVLACASLIGGRGSPLSVALYLFALSRAAQPASAWAHALPSHWTWIGALFAAAIAAASVYGFVALCLRVPSGAALPRWRSVDRALPWYAAAVGIVYGISRIEPAGPALDAYRVFAVLIWLGYLCGLLAYLDRRRSASGEDLLRTRWVALAIAMHVGIEAAFLLLSVSGNIVVANYLFMLNPAPFAFAYALVRGRIVDVRVFGGRALVYALLTTIPIAALSLAEWLFARQLADIKLATAVEAAIALAFSFWLQSLHRRIDRFVERVFFARRHRAHAALEEVALALPFAERIETIERLMTRDVRNHLELESAALYRNEERGFIHTVCLDCEAMPSALEPDDPLALFPRSQRKLLTLGAGAAAVGLPIAGGERVYAIAFYGEHRSGEAFDGEEERLLARLAQAAANAYDHLILAEREREIATLRARLASVFQR